MLRLAPNRVARGRVYASVEGVLYRIVQSTCVPAMFVVVKLL
jgi:hypothetical protein